MKNQRQEKAEKLSAQFNTAFRHPIVFEFSGSPKAGKTTVLNAVAAFLRRCGFKVDVVVERASVCPIRDKRHFHFNIWTACTSLIQMLERTQAVPKADDPQIIILDRGIFDSLCWMRMMSKLSRLGDEDRTAIEHFLQMEEWRKHLAGIIVMKTSPTDSMEREKGHLPVLSATGTPVGGSIMNQDILALFSVVVDEAASDLSGTYPVHTFDTSAKPYSGNVTHTCESVADKLLELIDMRVQEQILYKPKAQLFDGLTPPSGWIGPEQAATLVSRFQQSPQFGPRSVVEDNSEWVQALPVAIIRDSNGRVLKLRRREKDPRNDLHEKVVLWAGGHARQEDNVRNQPIYECLVRELDEELRLKTQPDEFKLVGAIYTPGASRKSARHLALVYEWIAPTESVAIVINAEEFAERKGNSHSGRFADVTVIVDEFRSSKGNKGPMPSEPWSKEILENYLASGTQLYNDLLS